MNKKLFRILFVVFLIILSSCSNKKISKNNIKQSNNGIEKNIKSDISKVKDITQYKDDKLINGIESVKFGEYPQNDVSDETDEPIEWIVLEKQKNKVLLLSKYILDCKLYNEIDEIVSWENCSLREWLNTVFYNQAFNVDEQKLILETKLDNYLVDKNDETKRVQSENITNDKVFLLSIDEVIKYFGKKKSIKYGEYEDTVYAKKLTTKSTEYARSIINSIEFWNKWCKKGIENGNLGNKVGTLFVASEKTDPGLDWTTGNSPYMCRNSFKNEKTSPLTIQPTGSILGIESTDERGCGVRPAIWISY